MFDLNVFLNDMNLVEYSVFLKKYRRKVPKDLLVGIVMSHIEKYELFEKFINDQYRGDIHDTSSIFLLQTDDGGYEYFTVEYGRKFNPIRCDLHEGVRRKIEEHLHQLGHDPVDMRFV